MASKGRDPTVDLLEQVNMMVQHMAVESAGSQLKMQEYVDDMHKQLNALHQGKLSADYKDKVQKYTKATTDMVGVMKAIKSEDPAEVLSATFTLVSSFAVLAGPEGVAVAALVQIASTFFVFLMGCTGPKKESLPEKIQKIVQEALENYSVKQLVQEVGGYCDLSTKIISELEHYRKEGFYKRYSSNRFDDFDVLLGKLRSNIEAKVTNDADAQRCLSCINAYVHLVTQYRMVLQWHLSLSTTRVAGTTDADNIQFSFDHITQRAKSLLDFLSDRGFLGPAGMIGDNKLLKMKAYRSAVTNTFSTIRKFLITLGVEHDSSRPVYSIDDVKKAVSTTPNRWPLKWGAGMSHDGYYGGGSHFVFFNQTSMPIRIFSGTTGLYKNNMSFTETVQPHNCYEHRCGGFFIQSFATAGVFCIGEECENLGDVTNAQIIEFAMSIPFLIDGTPKLALKIVEGVGDPPGKEAYDARKITDDPCMSFKRGDKWYLLKGQAYKTYRTRNVPRAGPVTIPHGAIWRFCIQQTTVEELKQC